jgi:hypothetical protein
VRTRCRCAGTTRSATCPPASTGRSRAALTRARRTSSARCSSRSRETSRVGSQRRRTGGDARARAPTRAHLADRTRAAELEGALPTCADGALRSLAVRRRAALQPVDACPRAPRRHDPEVRAAVVPNYRNGRGMGGMDADRVPRKRRPLVSRRTRHRRDDRQTDCGVYWEPNVWMHHTVWPTRSPNPLLPVTRYEAIGTGSLPRGPSRPVYRRRQQTIEFDDRLEIEEFVLRLEEPGSAA